MERVNDFRKLDLYYDLIFDIMKEITNYSFKRDWISTANMYQELIVNASPYIEKPKEKRAELNKHKSEIYKIYNKKNPSNEEKTQLEEEIDKLFEHIFDTRIEIMIFMAKLQILIKTEKVQERNVNPAIKRGDNDE